MSRWVEWGGKKWGRGFFDPPLHLPRGACRQCGGLGVVAEQLDEEHYEVAVACPGCREWCGECHAYVRRGGHDCTREANR